MASIDPALAYDGDLYDGMTEIYDTLVAVRKSTGLTGLDLVPDLAEQLPTPTDGGLTYSSNAPGHRAIPMANRCGRATSAAASNARSVEPSGQRLLQPYRRAPASARRSRPVRSVQRHRHRRRRRHGHLSSDQGRSGLPRGIEHHRILDPGAAEHTDDARRRHHAGAGNRAVHDRAVHPDSRSRLVRNPHFVRWSSAAQPDGYPDQIVWKGYPSQQAAIKAVGAGSGADVIYVDRSRSQRQHHPAAAGLPPAS